MVSRLLPGVRPGSDASPSPGLYSGPHGGSSERLGWQVQFSGSDHQQTGHSPTQQRNGGTQGSTSGKAVHTVELNKNVNNNVKPNLWYISLFSNWFILQRISDGGRKGSTGWNYSAVRLYCCIDCTAII